MQPHTSQIDPHLDGFLCDVLVDFGGRVLVETMQKHLKQSGERKATVNTSELAPGLNYALASNRLYL